MAGTRREAYWAHMTPCHSNLLSLHQWSSAEENGAFGADGREKERDFHGGRERETRTRCAEAWPSPEFDKGSKQIIKIINAMASMVVEANNHN
jgi:hypothetical protein